MKLSLHELRTTSYANRLSSPNCRGVAFCEAGTSTTVENPLQISSFMQNKANFPDDQMNVNKVLTKDYGNISNCKLCENKANTKPNKANLLKAKMNVNFYSTKDYENISNWTLDENKANTNPIRTQSNPISKAKNAVRRLTEKRILGIVKACVWPKMPQVT